MSTRRDRSMELVYKYTHNNKNMGDYSHYSRGCDHKWVDPGFSYYMCNKCDKNKDKRTGIVYSSKRVSP